MLNKYDYTKLLHDIKRVSKGIKIISDENDADKRKLVASLLEDEVNRLYADIEEIKNANGNSKNK